MHWRWHGRVCSNPSVKRQKEDGISRCSVRSSTERVFPALIALILVKLGCRTSTIRLSTSIYPSTQQSELGIAQQGSSRSMARPLIDHFSCITAAACGDANLSSPWRLAAAAIADILCLLDHSIFYNITDDDYHIIHCPAAQGKQKQQLQSNQGGGGQGLQLSLTTPFDGAIEGPVH